MFEANAEEKNNISARSKALKVLKTRLYELQEQEKLEKEGNERRKSRGKTRLYYYI